MFCLSFLSGSVNNRQSCFSIPALDDDFVEPEEHFNLTLINFMNGNPGNIINSKVFIMENTTG